MNSGIEELKKMFFIISLIIDTFWEIFRFLKQFAKICSVPTAVMSVVSPFVQMCHNRYSHHQSPPPKPHSMILLLIISTNCQIMGLKTFPPQFSFSAFIFSCNEKEMWNNNVYCKLLSSCWVYNDPNSRHCINICRLWRRSQPG